jgi:hypothetical protein
MPVRGQHADKRPRFRRASEDEDAFHGNR